MQTRLSYTCRKTLQHYCSCVVVILLSSVGVARFLLTRLSLDIFVCVSMPLCALQMNDNLVESWSDLDELKGAKNLETVYLERNPLQKDPQYRRKIMLALPTVRQIDATFVRF